MKIPPNIPVYGKPIKSCKITEAAHMATFFNILRRDYPEYAKIAIHIRNERQRTKYQIDKEKAQGGFVTGASDIIIIGCPTFVCEMKSQSPRAKISDEQIDFLIAAQNNKAFVCIALGWEAAKDAFLEWKCIDK
jgi:hypothetical protein